MIQNSIDGKLMPWADRFAIISRFAPTKDQIERAFGICVEELEVAQLLIDEGVLSASVSDVVMHITPEFFDTPPTKRVQSPISFATADNVVIPPREVFIPAKREQVLNVDTGEMVDAPRSRKGRGGSKIKDAFSNIPTVPMSAEAFATKYDVSVAVLRQSTRFLASFSDEERQSIGVVKVRQDPNTKVLMIWREPAS